MCGSNSEAQDGCHIHHSSHHRQDIAKDQHVPLRTFKTGLTDIHVPDINQQPLPLDPKTMKNEGFEPSKYGL